MPTKEATKKRREHEIENYSTVFEEGDYTLSQVRAIVRRVLEGLNESEWQKLERKYDLPPKARLGIHASIGGYWDFRAEHAIAKTLSTKIDTARDYLTRATESLAAVRSNRDFFKGVFAYYEKSPIEQAAVIDETLRRMQETQDLLTHAQERIRGPKHRPTHRSVWQGLATLEAHMGRWGRHLINDPGDFPCEVLCLADPKLTSRAFKSIFKEYLSVRRKWDSTALWGERELR